MRWKRKISLELIDDDQHACRRRQVRQRDRPTSPRPPRPGVHRALRLPINRRPEPRRQFLGELAAVDCGRITAARHSIRRAPPRPSASACSSPAITGDDLPEPDEPATARAAPRRPARKVLDLLPAPEETVGLARRKRTRPETVDGEELVVVRYHRPVGLTNSRNSACTTPGRGDPHTIGRCREAAQQLEREDALTHSSDCAPRNTCTSRRTPVSTPSPTGSSRGPEHFVR